MKELAKTKEDLIFSLDIGTRTIIGIVGEYTKEGNINILAYSVREHKKRNMYDGQIHDIDGVASLVLEVKEDLEKKLARKLKKVSIAAAGRALRTHRIKIEQDLESHGEIKKDTVEVLELEAVQKAQEIVNNKGEANRLKYYNIGYTVVDYYLDGDKISKLEGHRGSKIGVELLVTFLPQVVIEGLYSVISKSRLEIKNITLEPIAAINIAIKEELRLLNLALVDIGAGTSDIAITKEGKILAYAMTSKAGDEITEALCKKYLLDFNVGEELKIKLNSQDKHEFTDVVGIKHRLSTEEIVNSIGGSLEDISDEIVKKILEFNEKAPSAVFLIGGSSQMPGLDQYIANKLGLPRERVSIRDTNFIENLQGLGPEMKGPDIVTPIGIAVEGAARQYENFIEIKFNGEDIRIFNSDKARVSDLLVLTDFNPRDLIAKLGDQLTYYLNGEKQVLEGEEGRPAEIWVNNKKGNLNTSLRHGDEVKIRPASRGKKRKLRLNECIPMEKLIWVNNRAYNLILEVRINGKKTRANPIIREGDRIDLVEIKDMAGIMERLALDQARFRILLNGKKVGKEALIKEGDQVQFIEKKTISLNINGDDRVFEYEKEEFLFVDIFDYIDFDLRKPRGKLVLRVNGKAAEYMAHLKDGDKIEVFWQK